MKQFYIPVFLFGLLFAAGCGANQDNGQIAKEVCDCMRPLFESYNSIKDARDVNDPEALQRFVEKLEAVNEEVSVCAERIEERYGVLEGEREERVKAAMREICPEVIQTLNEAERTLMQ